MSTSILRLPVRIAIADDHPMMCEAIKSFLRQNEQFKISYMVNSGEELLSIINDKNTDVLILDLGLPVIDGIECIKFLKNNYPKIKIIIFSASEDHKKIITCVNLGVNSYLSKLSDCFELINTVNKVLRSERYFNTEISKIIHQRYFNLLSSNEVFVKTGIHFTKHEIEVISYLCEEKTIPEIAELMKMSHRTVEGYKLKITKKIRCKGIAGIVKFATAYCLDERKMVN